MAEVEWKRHIGERTLVRTAPTTMYGPLGPVEEVVVQEVSPEGDFVKFSDHRLPYDWYPASSFRVVAVLRPTDEGAAPTETPE